MERDPEGARNGRRITRSASLLSNNSSAPSAPTTPGSTPVQRLGLNREKKLASKATRNEQEKRYEKRKSKLPPLEEDEDSENGNIKFTYS